MKRGINKDNGTDEVSLPPSTPPSNKAGSVGEGPSGGGGGAGGRGNRNRLGNCYGGTLIPIINTTLSRLCTAPYPILILSQVSTFYLPTLVRAHHSSWAIRGGSSEESSTGNNPVMMYLFRTYLLPSITPEYECMREMWVRPR